MVSVSGLLALDVDCAKRYTDRLGRPHMEFVRRGQLHVVLRPSRCHETNQFATAADIEHVLRDGGAPWPCVVEIRGGKAL